MRRSYVLFLSCRVSLRGSTVVYDEVSSLVCFVFFVWYMPGKQVGGRKG